MRHFLSRGITHRNGFVRKGSAFALRGVRKLDAHGAAAQDRDALPPIFANSFPKSGTHLLMQLAEGLPHRMNYGTFLSSMISSFQFREAPVEWMCGELQGMLAGEVARGHLFYDPASDACIARQNVVHYFIYRDPRAVVVSEAHYLREMNRWHRLAPYFRNLDSIEEAITFAIRGFETPPAGIDYPNIAARFARYRGWLENSNCFAVKYEALCSEERPEVLQAMAEFYLSHASGRGRVAELAASMAAQVQPRKSHTFRSGTKSGWKKEFTPEHRRLFDACAGDLLIELGYEPDHDWVEDRPKAPAAAAAPEIAAALVEA